MTRSCRMNRWNMSRISLRMRSSRISVGQGGSPAPGRVHAIKADAQFRREHGCSATRDGLAASTASRCRNLTNTGLDHCPNLIAHLDTVRAVSPHSQVVRFVEFWYKSFWEKRIFLLKKTLPISRARRVF